MEQLEELTEYQKSIIRRVLGLSDSTSVTKDHWQEAIEKLDEELTTCEEGVEQIFEDLGFLRPGYKPSDSMERSTMKSPITHEKATLMLQGHINRRAIDSTALYSIRDLILTAPDPQAEFERANKLYSRLPNNQVGISEVQTFINEKVSGGADYLDACNEAYTKFSREDYDSWAYVQKVEVQGEFVSEAAHKEATDKVQAFIDEAMADGETDYFAAVDLAQEKFSKNVFQLWRLQPTNSKPRHRVDSL